MVKIETGIPAPVRKGRGRPASYPFADMKVGDSFFVECDEKKIQHIRVYASSSAKRLGFRFTVSKEAGGVRCWRVA